jgi:hypothetical protein
MLMHEPWTAVPGLRHGFLDARDSAGAPPWGTALARLGVTLPVAIPQQVHGARVLDAAIGGERPRADGFVAAATGLLVGVVTADCVPVLLVDRARGVAAAVHAGWRGAALGVLEASVAKLVAEHGSVAGDLEAVIGPAVAGCCYEVGSEVLEAFRARVGDAIAPAWDRRGGRLHVDLRTAVQLLLARVGVTGSVVLGPCTACGTGYHSYRRDGGGTGRQLSFVGWA